MNKQYLLKSVSQPDEKLLLSKALDQAFLCSNKYMITFTEFLDPLKQEKFKKIIGENLDVKIHSFGGAPGCERQMLSFTPQYEEIKEKDYPMEAVEIQMNSKFSSELGHRDFLGSILGCGVDRSKVGDIFIFPGRAVTFIHEDMAGYVAMSLTKVKHTGVKAEIINPELVFPPLEEYEERIITLQSLRLDELLSSAFRISRSQASKLITADKALVNWNAVRNPDKSVSEGDMVTLRGYGRVKVSEIAGQSKKDKIIVKIQKSI